jgi:hypothetical protein
MSNKESNEIIKAWRQSNAALRNDVVSCFKTDYGYVKSIIIHLESLFRKKGIENETTNRINDAIKYIGSWETYYDILRFEIISHRQERTMHKDEIQRLREEIIILKQDKHLNEYGK